MLVEVRHIALKGDKFIVNTHGMQLKIMDVEWHPYCH